MDCPLSTDRPLSRPSTFPFWTIHFPPTRSRCSHAMNCSYCSSSVNCSHGSLFALFVQFGLFAQFVVRTVRTISLVRTVRCSHCSVRTVRTSEQRTRLFAVRWTLLLGLFGVHRAHQHRVSLVVELQVPMNSAMVSVMAKNTLAPLFLSLFY